MLLFHRENIVLYAVPKTGSTSLEGALAPRASVVMRDPPALKHATVQQFERFLLPALTRGKPQTFESVAVIREPVDWLGSWYRYRHRDEIAGHKNSTQGMSFEDFILDSMLDAPSPPARLGSQARFLTRDDGTVGVDHLFRYEEMDRLVSFLEARIGGPLALPRRNVSPEMALTLSPDVRRVVETVRREEFALWEAAGGYAAR